MTEAKADRRRPRHEQDQRQPTQHFGQHDAAHADGRGAQQGDVAALVGQCRRALLATEQIRQVRHRQHAEPEAEHVPGSRKRVAREQHHDGQTESDQADQRAGAPAWITHQRPPVFLQDADHRARRRQAERDAPPGAPGARRHRMAHALPATRSCDQLVEVMREGSLDNPLGGQLLIDVDPQPRGLVGVEEAVLDLGAAGEDGGFRAGKRSPRGCRSCGWPIPAPVTTQAIPAPPSTPGPCPRRRRSATRPTTTARRRRTGTRGRPSSPSPTERAEPIPR